MKGVGLSTQLGKVPELPRKLPASPPTMTPTVSDPSLWCREAADVTDPGVAGHLLELFKEGHSGLGALQGELQRSREEVKRGLDFCFRDRCRPALGTNLRAGLEWKGRLLRQMLKKLAANPK